MLFCHRFLAATNVASQCSDTQMFNCVYWLHSNLKGSDVGRGGWVFFNVVVELLYIFIEIENVNSKSFNLWQSDSYPYLY